jgi:hypothetical protein
MQGQHDAQQRVEGRQAQCDAAEYVPRLDDSHMREDTAGLGRQDKPDNRNGEANCPFLFSGASSVLIELEPFVPALLA